MSTELWSIRYTSLGRRRSNCLTTRTRPAAREEGGSQTKAEDEAEEVEAEDEGEVVVVVAQV
jgi:hypothetical protein